MPSGEDQVDIAEAEISLDLTTTFVGFFDFTVFSPQGTGVQLLNNTGGIVEDLDVTISESGLPFQTLGDTHLCGCRIQPTGPGSLADFVDEDATGDWLLFGSSFEAGTLNEWCVAIFPDDLPSNQAFIRGDANDDGVVSAFLDATRILTYAFADAEEPPCLRAADVNGDNSVAGLVDAEYLLLFAFVDGPPPPSPYPDCGLDTDNLSPDLSCDSAAAGCD